MNDVVMHDVIVRYNNGLGAVNGGDSVNGESSVDNV